MLRLQRELLVSLDPDLLHPVPLSPIALGAKKLKSEPGTSKGNRIWLAASHSTHTLILFLRYILSDLFALVGIFVHQMST